MAVAFDAVSTTTGAAVTSTTHTHTPVGTPTLVSVSVTMRSGIGFTPPNTATGVTYGGVSMTKQAHKDRGDENNGSLDYWVLTSGVPTGAQSVVVTLTTSDNVVITARTYTGTNGSFGTAQTSEGDTTSTGTATPAVSSASGELVDDALYVSNVATGVAAAGGQTERSNLTNSVPNLRGATSEAPGAASVTMSWTWSANGNGTFAHLAIPIQASSDAAPDAVIPRRSLIIPVRMY